MKHKLVMIMLSVALIVGLALTGCVEPAAPPEEPTPSVLEFKVYTGGTGGTYFPIGSKYAELLSKYSDKIEAVGVTTGASVTNCKAIGSGETTVGMSQNDVAYYAYNGLYMFEKPITNLRGVATLWAEPAQFVSRAESGIKTLADLKGKRVNIGAPGSGCAVCCEQILRAAGVWDDIVRYDMTHAEQTAALKMGQIDVAFLTTAVGSAVISEVAATTPIDIVNIEDETLNKLYDEGYVFYVRTTIPKGTYVITEDVRTITVLSMLGVDKDMPDDIVYEMTKILFEHNDELTAAHACAAAVTLDTGLDGMSIKLHPGAVKYYEEKGILVPAELK